MDDVISHKDNGMIKILSLDSKPYSFDMFHGFNNKDKCFKCIRMHECFNINNFNDIGAQENSTKFHEDISSRQSKEINFNISDCGNNSTELCFNGSLVDFQNMIFTRNFATLVM